jgi:hypothetical protein
MDVSQPSRLLAADALALRYGADAAPAPGPWNEPIGGADSWTRRIIGRMGKIAAMSGRDKMVAALHAMGFELR